MKNERYLAAVPWSTPSQVFFKPVCVRHPLRKSLLIAITPTALNFNYNMKPTCSGFA
jgi:hypothetical protein